MPNEIEEFYLRWNEPLKSTLLAIRGIVLKKDPKITESWKYSMPFFCYRGKMFCYLWIDKKNGRPYLGLVEGKRLDHPMLIKGNRSRMKILQFDPEKDIPVRSVNHILSQALDLYRKGIVPLKQKHHS